MRRELLAPLHKRRERRVPRKLLAGAGATVARHGGHGAVVRLQAARRTLAGMGPCAGASLLEPGEEVAQRHVAQGKVHLLLQLLRLLLCLLQLLLLLLLLLGQLHLLRLLRELLLQLLLQATGAAAITARTHTVHGVGACGGAARGGRFAPWARPAWTLRGPAPCAAPRAAPRAAPTRVGRECPSGRAARAFHRVEPGDTGKGFLAWGGRAPQARGRGPRCCGMRGIWQTRYGGRGPGAARGYEATGL